ncbi:MAG: hypothetical protein HYW78_04885 [Parcubacteria group bacterium]|nr:hypothetical protein [Parcubacteria group bacterium]
MKNIIIGCLSFIALVVLFVFQIRWEEKNRATKATIDTPLTPLVQTTINNLEQKIESKTAEWAVIIDPDVHGETRTFVFCQEPPSLCSATELTIKNRRGKQVFFEIYIEDNYILSADWISNPREYDLLEAFTNRLLAERGYACLKNYDYDIERANLKNIKRESIKPKLIVF